MVNNHPPEEERFEEEPPLEAFMEEEPPQKTRPLRKAVVIIVAAVVALAMLVQGSAFLFQHFSLDALRFTSESQQLEKEGDFEPFKEAVVAVQTDRGHGTGFIISESGDVLTNEHVIRGASSIYVHLPDGERYEATETKTDETNDLAMLALEGQPDNLPTLTLADTAAKPGNTVYVIGHPMTHSYITNKGEVKESHDAYQVLAITNAVFPGHSGSPVLSEEGEVIGVVYARSSGENGNGEGLAVPLRQIHAFVEDDSGI
ncbi:S1C family serine protease [Shouchella clausii]|uniref:Serine protease n=1 Tax=Shouchella clausii TaxID=79880 RepID=A0A268P2U7_SHOCL|nr:serine protease [Shouchella clausii]MBX0319799.1 serine protease [Shouchella clausii]MDO7268088.1 serine protease [Shouchella clausii]MDO7287968.1 serine protease [Shouchella clausii]PAE90008.1 hypothetical protein CHH72_03205 [Shouchella clausii]